MKNFISVLLLLAFVAVSAQWKTNWNKEDKFTYYDQQRLTWGYFVGMNYFDFKLHPTGDGINEYGRFNVESVASPGFSAGLMGRMRINDYFDLFVQPGIHFTERTLYFNHIRTGQMIEFPDGSMQAATPQDSIRDIKSSYIDVPIFLQLHGDRWFNTRPYIQAGLGYAVNLQSEEKSTDDNYDGVFRMKTHGFNWQIEGGISIYFRRFKLTPSVKGIFFFNNELVADDPTSPNVWAGALSAMHTRAVVFSVKFE
ncbi:MAG: porin family protein [Weeksellaceae bacterium]|nr:porin family protein [Weeksellaceae bacterium]